VPENQKLTQKFGEAADWYPARSRNELKQPGSLFIVDFANVLPEPHNLTKSNANHISAAAHSSSANSCAEKT